MWTIAVCGTSADMLAERLARHLARHSVISPPSEHSMPLRTQIIHCVDGAARFTMDQNLRPKILLICVDPPGVAEKDFAPLEAFVSNPEERRYLPFFLSKRPSDTEDDYLASTTTFGEAAEVLTQVLQEPVSIDPDVADMPLLTGSIAELSNIKSEINYRSLMDEATKGERGLGEGTVLVFSAMKGGTGKSIMSILASGLLTDYAMDQNKTCIALDCNIGQPSYAGYMWREPRKDIGWVLSEMENGSDPQTLIKSSVTLMGDEAGRKIATLAGTLKGSTSPMRRAQPEVLYKLVCAAASLYDYVVVDTPPLDGTNYLALGNRFIMPSADKLILIADSDHTASNNMFEYLASVTAPAPGAHLQREDVIIALNKVGEHPNHTLEMFMVHSEQFSNDSNWEIAGGIPYIAELKASRNTGSTELPSFPEINKVLANVLAAALDADPENILPSSKKTKKKLFSKK